MNEEIERQARLKEIEQLTEILKKRKNEFEANYKLVYSSDIGSRIKLQYKEKEYAKKRD